MKNGSINKIRIPASFMLLYASVLNAVFADNTYFIIFALASTVFSAFLLFCCIKEDKGRLYKILFSVTFTAASVCGIAGMTGNIICYRIAAALFIIISVSEIIRLQIRSKNNRSAHIATVIFAYIPLCIALCFICCDLRAEMSGNGTVYLKDHGEYDTVIKRTYTTQRGYSVIYYPDAEKDTELPVIAYLHGFFIFNTSYDHEETLCYLASCGYIVIAPNYESMFMDPENYDKCAARQIKDGISFAENKLNLKPAMQNGEYLLGLIGHSVGAVTSFNLCSENALKILSVKFIVALEASDGGVDLIPKKDVSKISKDVNILMVVGSDDTDACFKTSSKIWNGLSDHLKENKAFYVIRSDEHGEERVVADHRWMKTNGSNTDNLIKYGERKWCKAIAEWSFYNENYDEWHGEKALYMGEWSDGTPLKNAASGIENLPVTKTK